MKTKRDIYVEQKNKSVNNVLDDKAMEKMVKEFRNALKDKELLTMVAGEILHFCKDHQAVTDEVSKVATIREIIKQWSVSEQLYSEQFKVNEKS